MLPSLCGRDPAGLGATEMTRAVIESVAENTCDAVVAPLLWGAVAGLPGLAAYRAVNTLDAMVGYRSPRYLRFGWASARLDDVANWVPARVTAALTVACAPVASATRKHRWSLCRGRPPRVRRQRDIGCQGRPRRRRGPCSGTALATRARMPGGARPPSRGRSACAWAARTFTAASPRSARG